MNFNAIKMLPVSRSIFIKHRQMNIDSFETLINVSKSDRNFVFNYGNTLIQSVNTLKTRMRERKRECAQKKTHQKQDIGKRYPLNKRNKSGQHSFETLLNFKGKYSHFLYKTKNFSVSENPMNMKGWVF